MRTILLFSLFLLCFTAQARPLPNNPPVFVNGVAQSMSVCISSPSVSINAMMAIADADSGQTEVWSVHRLPSHGSLDGFSDIAISTGDTITPTVYSYRPATGYTGPDTFAIRIWDGIDSSITTVAVMVNPLPVAGVINGVSNLCAAATATYTDSIPGGVWSVSNSRATITSAGVLTGVAAGVDTIYYTVTTSCGTARAMKVVNIEVYPTPGTTTGADTLCRGSINRFTNTVPGGTWSSDNIMVASVVTTTGYVTGVMPGNAIIFYSITNSCGTATRNKTVTIGAPGTVGAITGNTNICQFASDTLRDTTAGGTWSSAYNITAIVGSLSGIVTGITPGTATIIYTKAQACGIATATATVRILPLPVAATISGRRVICLGDTSTLSASLPGGVWSTRDSAVATVGTGGMVTGIASGTAIISYTITTVCGSAVGTYTVNISPSTAIEPITGLLSICQGATTALSDSLPGGVWSTSDSTVATIDATSGVATGLTTGAAVISYTVTLSCATATATATLTVKNTPTLSSTLTPPAICDNSVFIYTPVSVTPGADFFWHRPFVGGITNAEDTGRGNPFETLHNSTYYDVAVTYDFTVSSLGCSSIQTLTVVVHPTPRLSSDLFDTICTGGAFNYVSASATSGVTFEWNRATVTGILPATSFGSGDIHDTLTNTTTGALNAVYAFVLTANGCTNAENVTVTVSPVPTVAPITTQSPNAVCKGTMYQNFGVANPPAAGVSYAWSATGAYVYAQGAGHQYALVNFPTTGRAVITLTALVGAAQCKASDSVVVNVGATAASTAEVLYFNYQFVYTDNEVEHYQWGYDDAITLDSSLLRNEVFQSYPNNTPNFTNYRYWVMTTKNGCTQKTYYNTPLGVATANKQAELNVYPNPTSGALNVQLAGWNGGETQVAIVNMMGQQIKMNTATGNATQFDVAELPAGCYLINCTRNGIKIATARFIKN